MLHKFKVKESNTIFYYDNHKNTLFDKDKNPLSKQVTDFVGTDMPFSDVTKHNKPLELKIILGQTCNYSCGYCVQRDVGDHDRKVSHFNVAYLINNIKENLDISQLDQLELWGGETLLYWEEIKQLMLEFDTEEFDFVIPTNGTILSIEHINFFSSLKGRTTIELSHDGPLHSKIRGVDFLERIVPVLQEVEKYPEQIRFVMSVTITNKSYDLIELNDWFREFYKANNLKPIPLMFRPVWAYNSISKDFSLNSIIDKYTVILKEYLTKQINQFKRLGKVTDDELVQSQLFHITIEDDENNGVLQLASNFRYEMDKLGSTICGMHQKDHLTIDNIGNIRACQNVGGEYFSGNIMDFKTQLEIPVKNISVKKNLQCLQCPVYSYCLSGCPLDLSQEMFDMNCKINFAHYSTLMYAALSLAFNSEVEYLGLEE